MRKFLAKKKKKLAVRSKKFRWNLLPQKEFIHNFILPRNCRDADNAIRKIFFAVLSKLGTDGIYRQFKDFVRLDFP